MAEHIELLAPAGDMERLRMSLAYGADAVYLAGTDFGMRSFAGNFTPEELKQAVALCHSRGVAVHVTCNTMPRNGEIARMPEWLSYLQELGVDAAILADVGVLSLLKKHAPKLKAHISTQASVSNYQAAAAWHELGARRVVTARELSLEEIREIRRNIPEDMEIESFIHGAMCISYSGRCLLSNYFTGRDANQGACTHPCRWKYAVVEETRPGEYMPVYENDRGTFIFNSKDLCMIEHIPELLESGIDSFKIEGRMKTALYVAAVTRTYRKAIDDCKQDVNLYRRNLEWYKEEIGKCTTREFSTGFYFGKPGSDSQIYDNSTYHKNYTYLGTVQERDSSDRARIEQKNKFSVGETIEVMKPSGENLLVSVKGIYDEEGRSQESAPHARQIVWVDLGITPEPWDILRRREADDGSSR